jgi:hypothetical protein
VNDYASLIAETKMLQKKWARRRPPTPWNQEFSGMVILENAHKYRLHQDLLRWSLLAGYAAFFAASLGVLTSDILGKAPSAQSFVALFCFLIGTCYFLCLAIENWYYNLFAKHVKDTEERLSRNERPRTIAEFGSAVNGQVSPFHHSFFFALVVVLAGNTAFLYIALGRFKSFLDQIPHSHEAAGVVCFLCLVWVFIRLFMHWHRLVYRTLIEPWQNLFDPTKRAEAQK